MRLYKEWKQFLNELRKEFRSAGEPISMTIMSECLSSRFNLSPELCDEIVEEYCDRLQR